MLSSPSEGWTAEGGQVFLNAVRWAASPGLGGIAGRVQDAAGQPVAGATARVVETGMQATSADDGSFTIGDAPARTRSR